MKNVVTPKQKPKTMGVAKHWTYRPNINSLLSVIDAYFRTIQMISSTWQHFQSPNRTKS
jgi:hypothetical protein